MTPGHGVLKKEGPIAQLGARLNGIEEVEGSNPSGSIQQETLFQRLFRISQHCIALKKVLQSVHMS